MIFRSPYPDVRVPDVALHRFVLAGAVERADQPALIDGPSGRALTYGQLAAGVERLAAGLTARGFRRGDVLALFMPNLPEFALAFHGTLAAGGVVTTVNSLATVQDAEYQLRDAGARFLVTVAPFLDRAAPAAAQGRDRAALRRRRGTRRHTVWGAARGRRAGPEALARDGARPRRPAVFQRNDGVPQGRDADAPQPRGEPDPDCDRTSRRRRRSHHRGAAVLPHLRDAGRDEPRAVARRDPGDGAAVRARALPGAARGPSHHAGVRGPAARPRPRERSGGRALRRLQPAGSDVRRRAARRGPRDGLRPAARVRADSGVRAHRGEPGDPRRFGRAGRGAARHDRPAGAEYGVP